jgi:hypothetical protein
MFTVYFSNKIKQSFYRKLLGYIKTFKTKKFLNFSFFSTVNKMCGALVSENFLSIEEYSSAVKNQRK